MDTADYYYRPALRVCISKWKARRRNNIWSCLLLVFLPAIICVYAHWFHVYLFAVFHVVSYFFFKINRHPPLGDLLYESLIWIFFFIESFLRVFSYPNICIGIYALSLFFCCILSEKPVNTGSILHENISLPALKSCAHSSKMKNLRKIVEVRIANVNYESKNFIELNTKRLG